MRTATAALCAYCCGIVPVGCAGAVWLFPQLCAGVLCVVHGGGGDALFAESHERWYAGAAAGVADALQCGGDSSVLRHGGNGDVFPAVDAHGDDAAGADNLSGRGALPLCLGFACALAGAGGSKDAEMSGRGRGFVVDWGHDTFSLLSGGVGHAGGLPAGAAPEFS